MTNIQTELKKYVREDRKRANSWFFKTGKGEYGEGDKFLGVSNPDARKVACKFKDIDFSEIRHSLNSEMHEERLVALCILVGRFERSKDAVEQKAILKFYLENLRGINNWDLVDVSASQILGMSIMHGFADETILDKYAKSNNIWERRISIISTLLMIKSGKYYTTLRISQILLSDKQDLIHKAVGWALREVWKKDNELCENFLIKHYKDLPRTTLRYAIEKMPEVKRKTFLNYK